MPSLVGVVAKFLGTSIIQSIEKSVEASLKRKENIMKRMIVCAVVVAIAAGISQTVAASSPSDTNVVLKLKESVKDNWGKLSAWAGKVTDLRSEMDQLPDSAWFGSDKKSQRELIRDKVMKIRNVLLSTSAREIMRHVDDIDERIADIDRDIHKESARDVFGSAKGDNDTLKKLREKRSRLVREREASVRVVLRELESLGLRLSNGAEQCLFMEMVDTRDLIDAVVVAKSIGIVVENLRALMVTGDVAAAKRYFGMYLVMVEVQKACFDTYLEKSRTGEWREKLGQIENEAGSLRQEALSSAKDMAFTEQQRAAFVRNAEVNATTLNAVLAYMKILDQHASVIQAKADEAAKMLLVAENSYRTVSLTDEFLSLIKSNQDSFEALLQLQLPPIEIVSDAFQAEFAALTKKITNSEAQK